MYSAQQAYQTQDSGARAGSIWKQIARDAANSSTTVMTRRLHLVVLALLIAFSSAPLHGAAPGSISGVVRDSTGVPQIGAQVQLLRSDLTVIASVYTDARGRYLISSILPGRYAVKATGAWFLPALRENLRIRSATVVNLTLNTLYEVMQWLPAEPRASSAPNDDWAWTLRSAANRPLLRWLEDGPLAVASDSSGKHRRLKARLMASGQQGAFGESGERISAEVEDTPSESRELLAHVDFAPGTDARLEFMLGFRQDLGMAGSVQSVAAVALHPELNVAGAEGLDQVAVRTWETIHLGDEVEVEAGSEEALTRLDTPSPETQTTILPFASVGWHGGNSAIGYRFSTFQPSASGSEKTAAQSWLPALSARNGALLIEHGSHQELGWERRTDRSSVAVLVYGDKLDNPAVEAMSHLPAGDSAAAIVLLDSNSGLLHAAGPDFSTVGAVASFEHSLPGGNHLRLGYADGDTVVLSSLPAGSPPAAATLRQVLAGLHPRRTQTYTISLSGTLDGTGTRWQASYRWQPADTVTPVAPFALDAAAPYLNLHLRQPIHLRPGSPLSFELLLDLRNLLAEGYRPYLLSDGSLVIFAQDQRGFSAGLAFNF
jgi:hypothetical protein